MRTELARRKAEADRQALDRNVEVVRRRCQTLAGFVREAWHVLEPDAKLVWGIGMDAICLHLEAVTFGRINRLLINVPPGGSKSLMASVMWQAWEWGPCGLASMRYLTTAFNDIPVKRDTRKARDLILSEWYRTHWPEIELTRTAEMSFANSATGTREGVAFGSLTSQRANRLICDDLHSVKTAESDAERATTTRLFREGALNRLNDQEKSAIVVIMQRLHTDDVAGVILALKMGYCHLCMPMEFELDQARITSIGYCDPRTVEGELLDPIRFPRATVEAIKRDMGAHVFAGQYQQRPTPRGGGLFKRQWFEGKIVRQAPPGTIWVRHWDLAATKKLTAARTAGVKLGKTQDGRYVIGHSIIAQEEGNEVKKLIRATAEQDGRDCIISLPQDPGQAGKVQRSDFISDLAGYMAYAEPETGDKYTRAMPFSAQCEAGNVTIVQGLWNEAYIDELAQFPKGQWADQVDASSGAFGRLVNIEPAGPITGHSRRTG